MIFLINQKAVYKFKFIVGKLWVQLAFPPELCYTINRCKAHKNKVFSGLPPIPGVK